MPDMEQQDSSDAGIELFISIPIFSSDPQFLRTMQKQGKGDNFRAVKRQARSDIAMLRVSSTQIGFLRSKVLMDSKPLEMKESVSMSSPLSSSSSSSLLSSSVSDLFTFEEKDIKDFGDERINPRFRLLAEFYQENVAL